jgi:two-component system heavy metal sensor histidine kinase CusS
VKKSFRWHLFIRIFIATAVVIYSNRLIAQYVTTRHLQELIGQNIASTLEKCQHEASHPDVFLRCASKTGRVEALSSVSEYYVLCEPQRSVTSAEQGLPCNVSASVNVSRVAQYKSVSNAVQMREQVIDGDEWQIFSLKQTPGDVRVMIRSEDITQYVNSIWDLRDRILILIAPVVIFMLTLLTLFMTWVVMRPIRQLENSLTRLSSDNLDQPLDLLPPYREFSRFVTVFEQLRERLNQSFLQARRFAADASHELRTPLTILRGNSERLIGQLPTGSDEQIRMRLIGDEIERLIDITEKLLLLSRTDDSSLRYDMKPVSLSEIINEMIDDALAFQPTVKINSVIEPDILWVCDTSLVQQLIHNLYINAVKYNIADGWINMSLSRHRDHFVLRIENPCDNIPDDLPRHAFQRFYRADAARGRKVDGVGLGLSLCQEIARLHQAQLRLEVIEGKTVAVTLEGPLATG